MDAETETEPETETPNDSRNFLRPGVHDPRGTPVASMGATWVLADYVPELDPVWDRLYTDAMIRNAYVVLDIMCAAHRLLAVHYEMEADDAIAVVREAKIEDLTKAVQLALFGPDETDNTWTDWVVGSLAANGLRFEDVPADKLRVVMDTLVGTNRAIPAAKFISSQAYATVKSKLMRLAKTPCPPNSPPSSTTSNDTSTPSISTTTDSPTP